MNWEDKLRKAATTWKQALLSVGVLLNEGEKNKQPVDLWIKKILPQEFGMSQSTARVAMRWAVGDYGEIETARQLVDVAPHSLLARIPTAIIPQVTAGKHRIISRIEGRVVEKSLDQMSRQEVADNLTDKGWKPVDTEIQKVPRTRRCQAEDLTVTEEGEFIITTKGRDPIDVILPPKILKRLAKAIAEAA